MGLVFVFGSNTEGRHGKGAALDALRTHGAIHGRPRGRQGDSYAIVTKELRSTMPRITLDEIRAEVRTFLDYAWKRQGRDTFIVTKIGCGLAGFRESDIAPMFEGAPENVFLPEGWGDRRGAA